MKKILVSPFLLLFLLGYSQEKIPYVDFDQIVAGVGTSIAEGDHEKTLSILENLNENDSTYFSVLVSKAYYLMALDRNQEAIELMDYGLQSDSWDLHSSFYQNKGAALSSMKRFEEAAALFMEAIERYPKNHLLWYNLGFSLENLGKLKEAVEVYQQAIKLNPYYRNTYNRLGNIYYKQERISQALMSYNLYILMDPDAEGGFNSLKALNNIVSTSNDNQRDQDLVLSEDDDAFEELDLIISSGIAMNDEYETNNDINVALVRQNHALLDQLQNFEGNDGFWSQKFVPFYNWIQANGYFDLFAYSLCYSIENDKFKKIIEKNAEEISEFVPVYIEKWAEIVQNNTVEWYGEEKNIINYYNNGYLQAVGDLREGVTVGPWEFYSKDGRLTGKGSFNEKGERIGDWSWYNERGDKYETASYLAGKLQGKNLAYYDNRSLNYEANYKDGSLEGEYTKYKRSGALSEKKYFKSGLLDGLYISYHAVGEIAPEYSINYKEDNVVGKVQQFYADGTIQAEIEFEKGERSGKEVSYFYTGNKSIEMKNINGSLEGDYLSYHNNGELQEKGQMRAGNRVGNWQTFYSDGQLESESTYNDKGELVDTYSYYDRDGKLHYEFEYRNDELIAFKYFDKTGEVIKEDRKKGGEFYYTGYSPQGVVVAEGLYDVKGGKTGNWKYYYDHGGLKEQGPYLNNKPNGQFETFFNNGDLESRYSFENDMLTGYYISYHPNGNMKTQGWYKDNELHGEWRSYYMDGTLEDINFYHKGKFHGVQKYHGVDGRLWASTEYSYDDSVEDVYYTRDGKVFETVKYASLAPDQTIVLHHSNGKEKKRISTSNNIMHGPYVLFDFYGNKVMEGNYINGQQHGKWLVYYKSGNMKYERHYISGNRHGTTKTYYESGQIENEYPYEMGMSEGNWISYYENGALDTKTPYTNDENHGRKEFYDAEGRLQLIRIHEYGRIIGYSYLDTNSKEIPMIPIENETGVIKAYYDNGQLSREIEYLNGEFQGKYMEYFYDGTLKRELSYKNGLYHGLHKEYYESGQLKKEETYVYEEFNGPVVEYFENGKVKKETPYLNDVIHGWVKTYDESGKLILEEEYDNGEIYDSKAY